MFSLNRTQLIGFLTQNPEVRKTSSGTSVLDFTLVTVTRFTKADGSTGEGKTFHSITAWKGLADVLAQYSRAGSQIYIAGRLQTDSWDDEQGNKRYKTKVIAEDMILLDGREKLEALPTGSPLGDGLNRAEILGNLVRDPEVRQTTNGQSVCTFSVATDRTWKDANGEQQKQAEFHNIVVWGELAETIGRTMAKGRKVYVDGRVQVRSWETPEGQKKFATEVVADKVISVGHQPSDPTIISEAGSMAGAEAMVGAAPAAMPDIPAVNYESDVKPEDLPF